MGAGCVSAYHCPGAQLLHDRRCIFVNLPSRVIKAGTIICRVSKAYCQNFSLFEAVGETALHR